VRLGCAEENLAQRESTPRFNEAEARAPRMPGLNCGWRASLRRFNEAEARAPRMPPRMSPPAARSRRFNEAEARAPRMLVFWVSDFGLAYPLQ